MALVLTFLGLVLLRFLLLGVGAALLIRPVRACPACFRDTVPLHKPWLRRIAGRLEWRWCPLCGWQGLAKRTRGPARSTPWTAAPPAPPSPRRRWGSSEDARP